MRHVLNLTQTAAIKTVYKCNYKLDENTQDSMSLA